ncbi:MAG: beta-N-acetylhexosaminidase [Alphaproteobacteria bacterium]|nr:beta-N-acetylhexosaminidase [Alphaproteobacteria bacterium]
MKNREILSCMLSVSGFTLTDDEKFLLSKSNPLGITLFKRNINTKEQVKNLIKSIKDVIGRDDVLIATDQEGGRVCRFSEPEWNGYLSQGELGSLSDDDGDELLRLHAELIAQDLNELGVNWNYAPVLDVAYPHTTDALKSRVLSFDEKQVAKKGKILLETYSQNGICPCIKHLPGHGRAVVDPHLQLPVLTQSLQELEKDFFPFKSISQDAVAGMTAHIVISAVDDKPITQSKKAIDEIIRKEIGFNGFLISDAIDMKALSGSLTQKVDGSLDAGCDAVCYCFGKVEEAEEVINASKPLTDKAYQRFEKIKSLINQKVVFTDKEKKYNRYLQLAQKTKKIHSDYDAVEILHQMENS